MGDVPVVRDMSVMVGVPVAMSFGRRSCRRKNRDRYERSGSKSNNAAEVRFT